MMIEKMLKTLNIYLKPNLSSLHEKQYYPVFYVTAIIGQG